MAKKVDEVVEEEATVENNRTGIFGVSRKILLAAVGAAVVAEEEITSFIDNLVDRGELAEKDARNLVQEVLDRREKIFNEKRTEKRLNRAPAGASKADIATLNAKIAELSKQIDVIKKEQGKAKSAESSE